MGLTAAEVAAKKAAQDAEAQAEQKSRGWVNAVVAIRIPLDNVTIDSTDQEKLDAAVAAAETLTTVSGFADANFVSAISAETVNGDGTPLDGHLPMDEPSLP